MCGKPAALTTLHLSPPSPVASTEEAIEDGRWEMKILKRLTWLAAHVFSRSFRWRAACLS